MKKHLPLAIALGAGLMAFATVATVRAEPGAPDLPRCVNCPIFVFKDTVVNGANDGIYDTRVVTPENPGDPDTQTNYDGLWQLGPPFLPAEDLYIVIRPLFEQGKLLIGGDLKRGEYPNGAQFNGIQTKLWEDTSLQQGIFGDAGDIQYDNDVTTNTYAPHFGGDYRLWTRVTVNPKAIVLHVDNRSAGITNLFGWVWNQNRPIDKQQPNQPVP